MGYGSGLHRFFSAVVLGLVANLALAVEPSSSQSITIEPQSLASALQTLSKESGLQIGFASGLARNVQTRGTRAAKTPQQALDDLLAGTNLEYRFANENTVVIREKSVPAGQVDGGSRLRLAHAGTASAGEEPPPYDALIDELAEIVVTGTRIRGVSAPVGAPLRVYTREDIEQSGASTLEQFARLMPENLSNVDTIANDASSAFFGTLRGSGNVFQGAAFNLRGLGTSATLTLLNGHRIAASGADASMTDISQIPLAAIERIEVLGGGASAIYGSDAIAGVVNIITRKDYDGAQTSLRYGEASDGGAIEKLASQLLARSWGSGDAFLSYEYADHDGLEASQRDYVPDLGGGVYSLIPANRRNSFFLSARQELAADTTLALDALYGDRKYDFRQDQNTSTFQDEVESEGRSKQWGAALTLDQALSHEWWVTVGANFFRNDAVDSTRSQFSFTLPVPSELAALRETDTVTDTAGLDMHVNGTLGRLSAGLLRLAVGVGYREENFEYKNVQTTFIDPPFIFESGPLDIGRHVGSAYAELQIPVIDDGTRVTGIQRLALSLAARYDDYSDFGSTTNPKIELVWEPLEGLAFKGSWGTSFKAPLFRQNGESPVFNANPVFDSLSPSFSTPALQLQGANADLRPEESESYSVSLEFRPPQLRDLFLTVGYFETSFSDRIDVPPTSNGFVDLNDPALAPFVIRDPPADLVDFYVNESGFFDPASSTIDPTLVEAIVDTRFINLARTEQSGVDFGATYAAPLRRGSLSFALTATRILKNDYQTSDVLPTIVLLNKFGQPPKWKGRGSASWAQGGFTATAAVNRVNAYTNSLFIPEQQIASWTTGDVNLSYDTGERAPVGALSGMTLALGISNVTDEEPPFVQTPNLGFLESPIPFDPVNASPVGRLIWLSAAKRW